MFSRTLEQCLIECDFALLEILSQRWEVEDLPTRRREAAAALAAQMLAPDVWQRVWEALSDGEQAALIALQSVGGQMPWQTLTRRWGQVRWMGPGRMARERPWETPESPAEGLWYWGLCYQISVQGPAGLYEAAFLPTELGALLPEPVRSSAPYLDPVQPPSIVLSASDYLLDDGCTFLTYLQNHRVRPGPEGEWPARDEILLTRWMRDLDPERLVFLRHLIDRLSWLRIDDSGRLRPDPNSATTWLQSLPDDQRATLIQTWLDSTTWNDLWYVPTLQPDDTGSWRNDPQMARQTILHHLADVCSSGDWYAVADFVTLVRELDPDFQRPDGDYSTWYIRDRGTGEYLRGFESWDAVEGALIHYLLTKPMAWLGLVDLGVEREGERADVFRLALAGQIFLEMAVSRTMEDSAVPKLTVRPGLTVLAPAARRYERFQLSRVADWVRSGDPYVYRLTAASLGRARRQGISPDRVATFLKEVSGSQVLPTLDRALARWSQHGPEVRLERGIVLQVQSEELMQELIQSPETGRFISEVLGSQAALIAPTDWPRLVQALVEKGLLPDLGFEDEGNL